VLNKEIPFLRIGLPFCTGIISGLWLKPVLILVLPLMTLSAAGFILSLMSRRRFPDIVYGISLNIFLWLSGLLLYFNQMARLSELDPGRAAYLCTVTEFPEEKPNSFSIILKINSKIISESNIQPIRGSIMIYLRKETLPCRYIPGDILLISLAPTAIMNRGNPDEFNYRMYMKYNDIKYSAMANPDDVLNYVRPEHIRLRYRALIIREKIIEMYRTRGITGERLALAAAITLGQKNMLDREQKQVFIKAGIMHIMAVSGLHAMILSLFVFNVLFFLKGRCELIRIILTVLFLWFFAFITGLTASVLRATLMFSFIQTGKLLKRNTNGINSVLASAFILMLIKPSVLFDAGFLLSYSAVIFIIFFYQDLYSKIRIKNWLADKIWQSAAVTLTAQAGTLPLTISLFNRFPTWFLLTNVIIVPVSSLLIIVGCLIPLTYPVRFISVPLASFMGFLTGTTQYLTEKVSSFPLSSIENLGMKPLQTFLLFIIIFISIRYALNRKSVPLLVLLLAVFAFQLSATISRLTARSQRQLIVYNTNRSSCIGIRNGNTLHLFTDTTALMPEVTRHISTNKLKVKVTVLDERYSCIRVCGKVVLITDMLNNSLLKEARPDIVILTGKQPYVEPAVRLTKTLNSLIVTGGVKSSFRIFTSSGDPSPSVVYYVRKSGAFITGL
jgi:competence protein ComEC